MVECFKNTRLKASLVHNITNYVSAPLCADVQYAIGARGIMADEENEVVEVCQKAQALNLNIGTLNKNTFKSMLLAGQTAKNLSKPIVLDPAGVGVSKFRTKSTRKLMQDIRPTCICGNYSEIKFLGNKTHKTDGVDANEGDIICRTNLDKSVIFAREFAKENNTIVAITSEIDVITDGVKTYCIHNGTEQMGKIVGSGCMVSALIAAFLASNSIDTKTIAAAIVTIGIAGEKSTSTIKDAWNYASFRNSLIDNISSMTVGQFTSGAKYEIL